MDWHTILINFTVNQLSHNGQNVKLRYQKLDRTQLMAITGIEHLSIILVSLLILYFPTSENNNLMLKPKFQI